MEGPAPERPYEHSGTYNHNGRLDPIRSDHIRALRALHQKKKSSVPLKRPRVAYYEIMSSQNSRASPRGKNGGCGKEGISEVQRHP